MEFFMNRIPRGALAGAVIVVLAGAGALVTVFATKADGAGPSPSPSPIPQGCRLHSPQPEAPLKLNLVATRGLTKAIVMEKEVFDCYDAQSTLKQIKDVETFVELVDRGPHKKGSAAHGKRAVRAPAVSVVAVTCTKGLASGRVSCKTEAVALGVTATPLRGCRPTRGTYPFAPVEQPSHPVEMSTVAAGGGVVKTVKVEKEVFDCGGRIGDLYLLTQRVATAGGESFGRARTRFSGFICLKNEATARVAQCKLFAP